MALIDDLEQVSDALAQAIVSRTQALQTALGPRPMDAVPLTEREQTQRYAAMRHDDSAWQALVDQHGAKPAVDYALHGEALLRQYPDEAAKLLTPDQMQSVTGGGTDGMAGIGGAASPVGGSPLPGGGAPGAAVPPGGLGSGLSAPTAPPAGVGAAPLGVPALPPNVLPFPPAVAAGAG